MAGDQVGQQSVAASSGGVQSVRRTFELLELLAEHGAMGLSGLAAESGLPLTTIHRLVGTLLGLGYVREESPKQYVLGPRMIHLGERSTRSLATWATPHLTRLVDDLGETANLAMLEGDEIVYVAQVPSRHSMRMFTEVGRRVRPHCTAVGKALLAQLADEEVEAIVRRAGMPVHTPNTITRPDRLAEELVSVRRQGYAIDDGEQEVGVRCVAVALCDTVAPIAISVSGPAPRMTPDMVRRAVPALNRTAAALAADLAGAGQNQ
jgi:IclR family transcriptional regulator, acetate operon repressor